MSEATYNRGREEGGKVSFITWIPPWKESSTKPSLNTSLSLIKKRHLSVRPRTHSCKEIKLKLQTILTELVKPNFSIAPSYWPVTSHLSLCNQNWNRYVRCAWPRDNGVWYHLMHEPALMFLLSTCISNTSPFCSSLPLLQQSLPLPFFSTLLSMGQPEKPFKLWTRSHTLLMKN